MEVDDILEYSFIKEILNNTGISAWIMLGATDSNREGEWTFMTSRDIMTFQEWGYHQPDGGIYSNCLYILYNSDKDAFMYDNYCGYYYARYICEIP